MPEHPIIMQPESVAAILAGRKTETRRLVKLGSNCTFGATGTGRHHLYDWNRAEVRPNSLALLVSLGKEMLEHIHVPFCHKNDGWEPNPADDTVDRLYPKWNGGDRLWVKETWLPYQSEDGPGNAFDPFCGFSYVGYKSGPPAFVGENDQWPVNPAPELDRWRSSMYMPRWASRLTLEVLEVWPERLEDINEDGARAEGYDSRDEYLAAFRRINRKRMPCPNPWVWVIRFKEVE